MRMETSGDKITGHARNVFAVQKALEDAGIEFLDGNAPGVRLHKKG